MSSVLPEDVVDGIFANAVCPVLFGESAASEDPLVIMVGGQPGAGKSRVGAAARQHSGQDLVEIIGDDLRPFHPGYRLMQRSEPLRMPEVTAQASGAWVRRAIEYAVRERVSVLVEGTFRSPKVAAGTAVMFQEAGFRVEVHAVAVSPEVSRLSIADRYVSDAAAGSPARFTAVDAHDQAFVALRETIGTLHREEVFDRFVVWDRVGVLYDSDTAPRPGLARVREVCDREWLTRPMGIADFHEWRTRADNVEAYLRAHHGSDELVAALLTQLDLDREYLELLTQAPEGMRVVRGRRGGGRDITRPYYSPR